jgi:hypothetical protein
VVDEQDLQVRRQEAKEIGQVQYHGGPESLGLRVDYEQANMVNNCWLKKGLFS